MSNNWFLYSPLERAWSFSKIEQVIKSTGIKCDYIYADDYIIVNIIINQIGEVGQIEFERDESIKIIFFKEYNLASAFFIIKSLAQNLGDDIFLADDGGSFNMPVHLLQSWQDREKLPPSLQNMDFMSAREYALQKIEIG